jgi:sensor domain CHASE-containing protein
MNLLTKLVCALLAVIVLSAGMNYLALRATVLPGFEQIEHDNAERNLLRVSDAISNELQHLMKSTRDWAFWDDTYSFAIGENDAYIEENLRFDTFESLGVDLTVFVDPDGQVLWAMGHGPGSGDEIRLEELFAPSTLTEYGMLRHDAPENEVTSIVQTALGPMLMASLPILTTDATGPVGGALVMAKFLDDTAIKQLRDQTKVSFDLTQIAGTSLTEEQRLTLDAITEEQPVYIASAGDEMLTVNTVLRDNRGQPALLLHVETPKRISSVGHKAIAWALGLLLIVGCIVIAVMAWMIKTIAVSPLTNLTQHVLSIGQTGDLKRRLSMQRSDEIGTLSKEFDAMIGQLAEARENLLEQSYYTGVAEAAAGVLHNIRNILNPIMINLWRLLEATRNAPDKNLDAAFAELPSTDITPERREKLITYVQMAVDKLRSERSILVSGLETVTEQCQQIEQILYDRDLDSRAERRLEELELTRVVRDAAKLLPASGPVPITLEVDPSVETMPLIHGHRIVITQIFGNLLVNAAESIQEFGGSAGKVEVTAHLESIEGKAMVHVEVRDNGHGIDADKLTMIFQRGFSTRKDKAGGLGLHWCANSLMGSGGRISASSDGFGKGATIHLSLPVANMTSEQAA